MTPKTCLCLLPAVPALAVQSLSAQERHGSDIPESQAADRTENCSIQTVVKIQEVLFQIRGASTRRKV